jgi:hypothetical protein
MAIHNTESSYIETGARMQQIGQTFGKGWWSQREGTRDMPYIKTMTQTTLN